MSKASGGRCYRSVRLRYARFVREYESIRAAEGRGSSNDDYYLALPYRDPSGRLSAQWALRARTFRYIERKIMPRFTPLSHYRLRILDLGAGNGWMSYRLASQGHAPVAVDLLTNDQDGLGAAKHYEQRLAISIPADSRRRSTICLLPIPNLIWRSSMLRFTTRRITKRRWLKRFAVSARGGTVLIADTPWYSDEWSGLRMLDERRALFIQRYGFPSDELKSLEFLTDQRLGALERRFDIQWQTHRPFYGDALAYAAAGGEITRHAQAVTVPDLLRQGSEMIILFHPRATKPRNCRLPLAVLALAAVLEGREEYKIVDGNLEEDPTAAILSTDQPSPG